MHFLTSAEAANANTAQNEPADQEQPLNQEQPVNQEEHLSQEENLNQLNHAQPAHEEELVTQEQSSHQEGSVHQQGEPLHENQPSSHNQHASQNQSANQHVPQGVEEENDVDNVENFQQLDPAVSLSEYQERQGILKLNNPTDEISILHQKISRELSKQVGIDKLSPFRRHLIVYSSLYYTLSHQRHLPPESKASQRRQNLSKLQTRVVFTGDMFVETFGAITLNTSGIPNVIGSTLLVGSFAFKTILWLIDIHTRHEIKVSQSVFLRENKGWLEKYHGHVMDDEDRLLFLADEGRDERKESEDGDEVEEIEMERPRRQDTEADLGIVRRRSTMRTI